MSDNSNIWPISRSELVGRFQMPTRNRNLLVFGMTGMVIGNIFLFVLLHNLLKSTGAASTIPYSLLVMWSIPFLILAVGLGVWWRRKLRWEAQAPRIWDADGCICPWCHEDVRSKACDAHGVDASHRDLLVAFYASPVLDNNAEAGRRLIAAIPKRPRRAWLSTGPYGWLRYQGQSLRDENADPAIRRRAIINMSLVWYALLACIVTTVLLLVPNGMSYIFASGFTALMMLIMPVFFVLNPTTIGPPKCKVCRHQCHTKDQETCNECGVDLRKPGAIVRREWSPRKAAGMVPLLIALYAAPFIMGTIVELLPTPARHAIWGTIGVPSRHFADLDPNTMTPVQIEEEANLLLHLARPNGPGIKYSFDRGFIERSLELGLLPESYREDAARSTVTATIELEETDGERSIVVVPRIDDSLLGNKGPRLAFGGISIDGGPWSPGATWTLVHHDLDEWWRENAIVRKPRPESQLDFRVPVTLTPGVHDVRARCWIVIDGNDWDALDLTFDAEGNPEFPAQAMVYDLPISTTISVR